MTAKTKCAHFVSFRTKQYEGSLDYLLHTLRAVVSSDWILPQVILDERAVRGMTPRKREAGQVTSPRTASNRVGLSRMLTFVGVTLCFVSLTSFWLAFFTVKTVDKIKGLTYRLDVFLSGSPSAPEKIKHKKLEGPPPILVDDFCTGCRYTQAGKHERSNTCQWRLLRILNEQKEKNSTTTNTLKQAQLFLAREERPDFCYRCDPSTCPAHERTYWRFDIAAPRASFSITHFLKDSVPSTHRLPPSASERLDQYVSNPQNLYPQKTHLFEFNPSIVQLPADQVPSDVPHAVYLASFRVSSIHNCVAHVGLRGGPWDKKSNVDYLGLALLDNNLQIIREVVIDAIQTMQRLQDARLFVLQNQIYVGSYHRIHPIWIVPPKENANNDILMVQHSSLFNATTKNTMTVTFRRTGACTSDRHIRMAGKNLNYFEDDANRTILEHRPMGPKELMNLTLHCKKARTALKDPIVDSTTKLPRPTFGTIDEIDYWKQQWQTGPPYTAERGGACCVHIEHKGKRLLLGVAHSKTRFKHSRNDDADPKQKNGLEPNHFFSSFYAMEATAPYRAVARTGNFCFGFSEAHEPGNNPYTLLQNETLKLLVNYDKCPRIHFVSGLVTKADDPSKLIIAYGLNDCTPRMVIVEKQDVIDMLFNPERMLPRARQ